MDPWTPGGLNTLGGTEPHWGRDVCFPLDLALFSFSLSSTLPELLMDITTMLSNKRIDDGKVFNIIMLSLFDCQA